MRKFRLKKYLIVTIILLGLFSSTKIIYAQTWSQTQDTIRENSQQIQTIDEKISDLKDNYRLLYDGAQNQTSQLGNQISFAGYILGAFSLVFAVLGIFIAWYVNRQFEKIKKMKDLVESTKKAIDGHSTDLYKKLKREETLSLLARLGEVPEDITNICVLLFSRDLLDDDYLCLRTAYLQIKNSVPVDTVAKSNYMSLLMQHFPYKLLKDSELKNDVIAGVNPASIRSMFSRDIKNFFDQVLKYLSEAGVTNAENKALIGNLFYFYSQSRFQSNIELQTRIKETLAKCGMRTPVISSIVKERAPADPVYTTWVDLIFT